METCPKSPPTESQGLLGEKVALVIRDGYSVNRIRVFDGLEGIAEAQGRRAETAFRSDTSTELQAAASRMCWTVSSALPDSFPHNAHVERELRAIEELSRPSHLQAGFHKRLWAVTVRHVSQARSFWGMAPINKERGADAGNFKLEKARWEVMARSRFLGQSILLVHLSSTVQKEVEWQSQPPSQGCSQGGSSSQGCGTEMPC